MIFTINATSFKLYEGQIQEGGIASILETNPSEASEFLSFIGIFPYFIFFCSFALFWIASKNVRKLGWKGFILLALLLVYPGFKKAILPSLLSQTDRKVYWEFREFPIVRMTENYLRNFLLREPFMIAKYYSIQNRLEDMTNKKRDLPIGISYSGQQTGPLKIVVILGESDFKRHHGIYGYEHPVDLFMMQQAKYPKNTAIFNAIAPAPITCESVFRVFSFASSRNIMPLFENYSLIEMAKQAGYQTIWLSKQATIGTEVYNRFIATRANILTFFQSGWDDELIEPFASQLMPNKKQFFVLHLQGSHMDYTARYDEEDYNKASDSDSKFRHYDATIAHTDKVLEKISRYGNNNTLFIYLPDHSELINVGHGFPRPYAEQFEIPFVAWSQNPEFIDRFRKIVKRHSIEDGTLFNTASFPLVVSEMMGFNITDTFRESALEDSKFIYNVDGKVYPLSDLPRYSN